MIELTEQQRINRMLRTKLRELCTVARRDATVFAVLTVLLTPVAIAIFLMALIFCLAFVDLPFIDHLGYRISFITGANLCLAFMAVSYFLRPKGSHQRQNNDNNWLMVAAGFFCAILALSYLTTMAVTYPAGFWLLYLLMALFMLGCIGHAYEPKDDYYLGWTYGPLLMDNPFTIEDDIDRAHIGLGFAVAISQLILESYGSIFGSRWLWRGLQESELAATATLLQGLAARDTAGVLTHLRGIGKESAADIVRALVKLDLVVIDKGRPKLSLKGQEFVEVGLYTNRELPTLG